MNKQEAMQRLAKLSHQERAILLKNKQIRGAVLNSGANVTLYCGDVQQGATVQEQLSQIYIGLIERKNKKGKPDGLGALGGMAERTNSEMFNQLNRAQRLRLIGQKDDIAVKYKIPYLTNDIHFIRKNNVLREMKEELADLNLQNYTINPDKLELVKMPHVKDDNYIINIWDGTGEAYAITPYCHLYKDEEGLIDSIILSAQEKEGGEVKAFKKMPLFEALKCYGNPGNADNSLEDGRSGQKDYRYPHEYLAAWGLAAKLLNHDTEKLVQLAQQVQAQCAHTISLSRIAQDTAQTMADIGVALGVPEDVVAKMDKQAAIQKNMNGIQQNKNYLEVGGNR